MKRSAFIQEELNSISKLVGGIACNNVFTVPPGFFEQVPATVLACIREAEGSGESVAANDAPDAVPPGYFDQLAEQILGRVKAEEEEALSPLLQQLKSVNPFMVPAGYFTQLPGAMVAQLASSESTDLLAGLHIVNPFTVPSGYFEQLPQQLLQQVKSPQQGRLVQMSFAKKLMRYAAAIVLGTGLAYGGYRLANNQPEDLATAALEPGIEKGMHMDEQKFNETLNSLSEEDVLKYFENNGTEVDVATLATKLSDNTLPTEEDYMLDDKALDKFIESINSTN